VRRLVPIGLALLVVRLATSATAEEPRPAVPAWPTRDWPRSEPAAQGLDAARLARLVELIRANERYPGLHALLIVRNGQLVVEEYFAGWTADRLHMQQSVTKSFTSALVGIAIAQGAIAGVDAKVLDFFPGVTVQNLDDRKRAMKLEDLLTMRSGTDYHERGPDSPHFTLNAMSGGWDRFVLDRPMVRQPGTHFSYDSGAVILTSAILKRTTGFHADEYAVPHLFRPLGIERAEWIKNREGHPHTGGGLSLRPQDMAKLGLLYLRDGRWEERQVVPAEWVRASFSRHVELGHGETTGYGYWWWISRPDPQGDGRTPIYSARGAFAQYIFIVPEHDMVVVVTGNTRDDRSLEFLYEHILPAVRRKR
jgi:CubicO group peptidase (beta-lactamase class C family)